MQTLLHFLGQRPVDHTVSLHHALLTDIRDTGRQIVYERTLPANASLTTCMLKSRAEVQLRHTKPRPNARRRTRLAVTTARLAHGVVVSMLPGIVRDSELSRVQCFRELGARVRQLARAAIRKD